MLKKAVSFIMIIIFTALLCSCSKNSGATLLVPISSDPMCLDPQAADTDSAKLIVSNCYEGLVRLDENYRIIPGVAESWNISADGKEYVFHLRKDTNWQLLRSHSDVFEDKNYNENFDTVVKAKDFAFGLQRAVNPATQAEDSQKLLCIENASEIFAGRANTETLGVYAEDDFTLRIRLSRANPDFLRLLTLPVCMPCNEEFFNKTNAKYGMETRYTLCNGPFYIARWTDDNIISVLRNEGYKGNCEVEPEGVSFVVNSDEASVIKSLKDGSYDCAPLSENMYKELKDNKKVNIISVESSVLGLCFNCGDEIIKNVNIRKALAMITIVDSVNGASDCSSSATGIVPECVRIGEMKYRDFAETVTNIPYNESGALTIWKAGLNELMSESAPITISCTEEYSASMQKIIQTWQRVFGTTILAKVDIKSEEDLEKAVSSGKYQIAVSSVKAESADITDFLGQFVSGSKKNIVNYSDTEYDKIVDGIINIFDGSEIIDKCIAAEKRLAQETIFFPIFNCSEYMAVGKDVSGIYASPAFERITFISGEVD